MNDALSQIENFKFNDATLLNNMAKKDEAINDLNRQIFEFNQTITIQNDHLNSFQSEKVNQNLIFLILRMTKHDQFSSTILV